MNAAQFAEAKELFLAIVDLDDSARAEQLDAHASHDAEVRAAVETWLSRDTSSNDDDQPCALCVSFTEDFTQDNHARVPVLSPGERLAGRYRIDAFIDRGGMGEVYRATDEALDAPVAIKVVRRDVASSPAALNRLKREVLCARSVTHPGVCRIFDFGRDEARDLSFLTMELLSGPTLSERLQAEGPLNADSAESLLRQLADALDAAHAAGIVHRDLKSANIIVASTGEGERAVITDFGLALPVPRRDDASVAGSRHSPVRDSLDPTAGTPAYMSPEQVTGSPVGPASDLYALGVVLYESVTGRLPFDGDTKLRIARARLTETPAPPSQSRDIDAGWDEVILSLLERDPHARPHSARAAVRALENLPPADDLVRRRLPAEYDTFVGRERQLGELVARLESWRAPAPSPHHGASEHTQEVARALAVLGPPGVGKTRLVTRYARERIHRWPGSIFWCDLSTARNATHVLAVVALALGVPMSRIEPASRIADAIDDRGRCLVILDNVEQVAADAVSLIERWLDGAGDASFLVTSRIRVEPGGAPVMALEPLEPQTEGVELFTARARSAQPGLRTDDTTRRAVVEIVEMLDGLPLAIELAAARTRVLGVLQLRDRLHDRLALLVGGTRGRHATLEAALDWSWDLLTDDERSAVSQCAVFEGSFSLQAAEAVVAVTSEPAPVLDVLQSLVDQSWLRVRVFDDVPRFDMYLTSRTYARRALETEKKPGDPASLPEVRGRHARCYAALATPEMLTLLEQRGGLESVSRDLGNWVTACRAAVEFGQAETAVACMKLACGILSRTGPLALAVELAREVLELPGLESAGRARTFRSLGNVLYAGGRLDESRESLEAALELYRARNDRAGEAWVLRDLCAVATQGQDSELLLSLATETLAAFRDVGNPVGESRALISRAWASHLLGRAPAAASDFEAALDIGRTSGNDLVQGQAHYGLGVIRFFDGEHEAACRHYESALELLEAVGDDRVRAAAVHALGSLHDTAGRVTLAIRFYEQSLAIRRRLGDRSSEARDLESLGSLLAELGRLDEAEVHLRRALKLIWRSGSANEGFARVGLGQVDASRGREEAALDHYRAALASFRALGPPLMVAQTLLYMADLHQVNARPAEARACLDEALEISREPGARILEGRVLVALGALDTGAGRADDARKRIEAGIEIMRASSGGDHHLAVALCHLSELKLRCGDPVAARESLSRAEGLALAFDVVPPAAAKAVERLRALVALDGPSDGPGT